MFEQLTLETFSMPVCITGSLSAHEKENLISHLKEIEFQDVLVAKHNFFDVESARSLTRTLVQKSNGSKTCLIYVIQRTNKEAQNTLLKTLEDYGGNTALILIIPHREIFLDTIYSRCYNIDLRSAAGSGKWELESVIDWIAWLDLGAHERMDKLKDVELSELRQGVDALEQYFHHKILEDISAQGNLRKIQKIREWLVSPNPSVNMAGEYMSLVL